MDHKSLVVHHTTHEQNPWKYNCPRTRDAFIMDIIQASDLSQEHQEIFNRVRINLRLLNLSDMVVLDSPSRILPDLLKGINHRKSKFNWPTAQQPPSSWMNIFHHAIKHVIRPHLLNNTLGKWINDGHQLWIHYSHPETNYKTVPPSLDKNKQPVDITLNRRRSVIGCCPTTNHYVEPPPVEIPPLSAIQTSPSWMQRLWSGTEWKEKKMLNQ